MPHSPPQDVIASSAAPTTTKQESPPVKNTAEELPKHPAISFFDKYLTVWVLACMLIGVAIGYAIPWLPNKLKLLSVANVSMPIAVLLWGMIYPMMVQIDLESLKRVWFSPRAIILTSSINYLVQPFLMYGLALLFFYVLWRTWLTAFQADQYVAGAVILGGSPCTAMVFVWSTLTNGDPSYTLTQVAVNDLLILVFYTPTVKLLLQVSNVQIPWLTLLASVVIFVLVPLVFGAITRWLIIRWKGLDFLNSVLLPKAKPFTIVALLLTLVLIFMFQAETIIASPLHILMIAVPLIIQTYLIWVLAYGLAYLLRLPYKFAAPGSMIAASNFFELAVAVTISVFGANDPSVLVTTVGVLTEVPVMLSLVFVCNRTKAMVDKRVMVAVEDAAVTGGVSTTVEVTNPAFQYQFQNSLANHD